MRGDNTLITKRKVTGVRIPENLDKQLQQIANEQGFTKNAVMIQAFRQFIKRTQQAKE